MYTMYLISGQRPQHRRRAGRAVPDSCPTIFDLVPLDAASRLTPLCSICDTSLRLYSPIDPSTFLIRDPCALCRQVSAVARPMSKTRANTRARRFRSSRVTHAFSLKYNKELLV